MFQTVPAQLAGFGDGIQPTLNVKCANVLEPILSTTRLNVILPDISVALQRRWTLVLFDVREIDALDEIPNRQDTLRVCVGDGCGSYYFLCLVFDAARRTFSASGD